MEQAHFEGISAGLQETFPRMRQMARTRRAKKGGDRGGDLVASMLTIRNQIKLYHWQTHRFSRHKATDDLVSSLDENIDKFVEIYMGK